MVFPILACDLMGIEMPGHRLLRPNTPLGSESVLHAIVCKIHCEKYKTKVK